MVDRASAPFAWGTIADIYVRPGSTEPALHAAMRAIAWSPALLGQAMVDGDEEEKPKVWVAI